MFHNVYLIRWHSGSSLKGYLTLTANKSCLQRLISLLEGPDVEGRVPLSSDTRQALFLRCLFHHRGISFHIWFQFPLQQFCFRRICFLIRRWVKWAIWVTYMAFFVSFSLEKESFSFARRNLYLCCLRGSGLSVVCLVVLELE